MSEWFKKLDLKKWLKILVILIGTGLIVFMTITNLGFKEDANFLEWFSNVMILVGIAIFGLFMGESTGYDRQKDRAGGLYQTALAKLKTLLEELEPLFMYFTQFYRWYLPIELENKKVEFLIANDIHPLKAEKIVKYCQLSDLYALKNGTIEVEDENGNKIHIRKLEEHEIEPVEYVLKGNLKLDAPSPAYYLTIFGKANSKRLLEKGKKIQNDIALNKKYNRIIKISSAVVVAIIWGFVTVKEFMSGDDMQAWMNLVSRVLMLITSLLSGWFSSVITVKLESQILENKYDVLTVFKNSYNKHLFDARSDEEIAKEEFEEQQKQNQEAVNNVVDPEEKVTPLIPLKEGN